jgi:hypothetical protein
MNSRDREDAMLNRCVEVALSKVAPLEARNGREANVFRIAAMVIQSRFAVESQTLLECAARHFEKQPEDLRPAADVIRNGDVISLPRLRDSLTRKLRHALGR